jgi:hypothetical protein
MTLKLTINIMKYTITTYADNGDEIVSRNYKANINGNLMEQRINYADQIESILEDSHTYLEEQALDYGEHIVDEDGTHECETDNSAGNVDADGTCLTCGKTDLI